MPLRNVLFRYKNSLHCITKSLRLTIYHVWEHEWMSINWLDAYIYGKRLGNIWRMTNIYN